VLYINAYRKEQHSQSQYDVFVRAIALYTRSWRDDAGELQQESEQHVVTLRIPVAVRAIAGINRYIVEDLPAFVTDDNQLTDHEIKPFAGEELDRHVQERVFAFLFDFFEAFYSERQSVIDNFLASEADRETLQGFNGILKFERIEDSSRVYRGESGAMLALVSLSATDAGGNVLRQNLTVHVIERDGRFFVRRLDTRINNVK